MREHKGVPDTERTCKETGRHPIRRGLMGWWRRVGSSRQRQARASQWAAWGDGDGSGRRSVNPLNNVSEQTKKNKISYPATGVWSPPPRGCWYLEILANKRSEW